MTVICCINDFCFFFSCSHLLVLMYFRFKRYLKSAETKTAEYFRVFVTEKTGSNKLPPQKESIIRYIRYCTKESTQQNAIMTQITVT